MKREVEVGGEQEQGEVCRGEGMNGKEGRKQKSKEREVEGEGWQ